MAGKVTETAVVGGVDTHKDLHVAAVIDQNHNALSASNRSSKIRHRRGIYRCQIHNPAVNSV
ncbi:hypothetical protein DFY16_23870 [Escherichia coli]|nr:hypothetical protein [Escherichia coli]